MGTHRRRTWLQLQRKQQRSLNFAEDFVECGFRVLELAWPVEEEGRGSFSSKSRTRLFVCFVFIFLFSYFCPFPGNNHFKICKVNFGSLPRYHLQSLFTSGSKNYWILIDLFNKIESEIEIGIVSTPHFENVECEINFERCKWVFYSWE